MSKFRLTGPAQRDLSVIWDFIAADNVKAADRLMDRFYEKFLQIALTPESYPIYPEIESPFQFAIVKPYVIFFLIQTDRIEIHRIIHGARDIPHLLEDHPDEK